VLRGAFLCTAARCCLQRRLRCALLRCALLCVAFFRCTAAFFRYEYSCVEKWPTNVDDDDVLMLLTATYCVLIAYFLSDSFSCNSTRPRPLVAVAAVHYPGSVCRCRAWHDQSTVTCSVLLLITALYCTSRLTGNAWCDNGTRCQDRLPPLRPVGVAMYTPPTMHTLATITINQQNRHSKQLIIQRQLYRTCTLGLLLLLNVYGYITDKRTFRQTKLALA